MIDFFVGIWSFLEFGVVFYPIVVFLIFLSILCLPGEIEVSKSARSSKGSPGFSAFFNFLMFVIVGYHFGIVVSGWVNWLMLIGAYLIVGIFWSSAKWFLFCRRVRDAVLKAVERFSPNHNNGDFARYMLKDSDLRVYNKPNWNDSNEGFSRSEVISHLIPQVNAHRGRVLSWLFCWPMSALRWLLADFLSDFYNTIFQMIRGWFQKIASQVFRGI